MARSQGTWNNKEQAQTVRYKATAKPGGVFGEKKLYRYTRSLFAYNLNLMHCINYIINVKYTERSIKHPIKAIRVFRYARRLEPGF